MWTNSAPLRDTPPANGTQESKPKGKTTFPKKAVTPFIPSSAEKPVELPNPPPKAIDFPIPKSLSKDMFLYEEPRGLNFPLVNTICAFCNQPVESPREMDKVSLIQTIPDNKAYLVHFKCYAESRSNPSGIRLVGPGQISNSEILINQPLFEPNAYVRSSQYSQISMTLEFYHPLSTFCFGRVSRMLSPLEHFIHRTEIAFTTFVQRSAVLFEPNILVIPYNEFRIGFSLFTHSNEEPYNFQFNVDFREHIAAAALTPGERVTFNISFAEEDNMITLQGEVAFDPNIALKLNYALPAGLPTPANIILNYVIVSLPLVRPMVRQLLPDRMPNQIFEQPRFAAPVTAARQTQSFNNMQRVRDSPKLPVESPKHSPMIVNLQDQVEPEKEEPAPVMKSRQGSESYQAAHDVHLSPKDVIEEEMIKASISSLFDNEQEMEQGSFDRQLFQSAATTGMNGGSWTSQNVSPFDTPGLPSKKGQILQRILPSSNRSTPTGIVHSATQVRKSAFKTNEDVVSSPRPPAGSGDIENIEEVNVVALARTKEGSKLLQRFFTRCSATEMDFVLSAIQNDLRELMTNQYANFMFKNLVQNCSYEQRLTLLQRLSPVISTVATDAKGTHALQSIVSLINSDLEEQTIEESIKPHISMLIIDPQATHFIQKVVSIFSPKRIEIILDALISQFVRMANNQFGLCVLKAVMAKYRDDTIKVSTLAELLTVNTDLLVQDPFGNYAIQYAFEIFDISKLTGIIDKILQKIVQLSIQKFSSNVVETCLSLEYQGTKARFIKTLCNASVVVDLMKNKYGNFVLQKALKLATKQEYKAIYNAIADNLPAVSIKKYHEVWEAFIHDNPEPSTLGVYFKSLKKQPNSGE